MRTRWMIGGLLAVPLVDTLLLLPLASEIGLLQTVLLVVLTGLVGMLLVRAEGRHTVAKIQQRVTTGELPTDELVDGGLLIFAGALLLTPGVVTDLIGFAASIPVTRIPIRTALKRYIIMPALDRRSEGFVSGNIWVGGTPSEDVVNLDPEEYARSTEDKDDN